MGPRGLPVTIGPVLPALRPEPRWTARAGGEPSGGARPVGERAGVPPFRRRRAGCATGPRRDPSVVAGGRLAR